MPATISSANLWAYLIDICTYMYVRSSGICTYRWHPQELRVFLLTWSIQVNTLLIWATNSSANSLGIYTYSSSGVVRSFLDMLILWTYVPVWELLNNVELIVPTITKQRNKWILFMMCDYSRSVVSSAGSITQMSVIFLFGSRLVGYTSFLISKVAIVRI